MQQLLAQGARLRHTCWTSKVRVCSMALHLQRHVTMLGALTMWRTKVELLGRAADAEGLPRLEGGGEGGGGSGDESEPEDWVPRA